MIVQTRENKDLVIPKSLGNFVTEGSGGGITPEEAAEIASAVTEEAISEYDTELQVDLEDIREAVSANTVTLLDLAEIAVMTVADRVALFDEIYDKAASGESVYIKGLVQEETIRTAILPLVSYRPETNPILHQGGYLYFAAKGDTDNIYFHIALSSEGAIDPTSSTLIKRNIYTLPTASSEVKGGAKIGSGLTMVGETVMVDTTGLVTDGDLAPFIVQLSGNTADISELSGVTETLEGGLSNLETFVQGDLQDAISEVGGLADSANTKVEALSAVTSALTQTVENLSGSVKEDVILDVAAIYNMEYADRVTLWDETYAKLVAGHKIFLKGEVFNGGGYYALIPLFKYLPETAPSTHTGGFMYFTAKSDASNSFIYYSFSSAGNISPNRNKLEQQTIYTLPTASSSTKGGIKVGSGLTMGGEVLSIKAGEGLGFSGDTLVVSGATGGGKTPIVLEEHYGDPTWTAIYNAVAQSAATMGVEEFAKNYDIYIKRFDDQENPYSVKQAVGFNIQQGEDWDETAEEWVQTTWVTFNTFENTGNNYWLLSTGSRGLGVIGGFDGNVPHPKSSWINIDASGNVLDYTIWNVDEALAQYPDNGTDYAFSMYLCCLVSDAERYRGNLQNYRKNYNGVNGNHFFRFIIDIDGTEYEAEYYWDEGNQQLVKIVFQTYKAYLQSILNS